MTVADASDGSDLKDRLFQVCVCVAHVRVPLHAPCVLFIT